MAGARTRPRAGFRSPLSAACLTAGTTRCPGPSTRRIPTRPLGAHLTRAWRGARPSDPVGSGSVDVDLTCGSVTGSTVRYYLSSASASSSNSGSFDGSIFRTNSSISLPGLNVTTFFEGT